jgi:flagellar biosynthesis chaperone FliJ
MEPLVTEAIVIPFPTPATAASEQQRLRRALTDLQTALADQKRALSDWRFAMTELGIGVAGLNQALGSYQNSLGSVETKLKGLREEAVKLECWADEALTREAACMP